MSSVDDQGETELQDVCEQLPAYTHPGFRQCVVPPGLFEMLAGFYRERLDTAIEEREFILTHLANKHVPKAFTGPIGPMGTKVVPMTPVLKELTHKAVRAAVEEWSGTAIAPTYVYGIRCYLRGALLKLHRDRRDTHILGAIINVAQQVDEPWPFVVGERAERLQEVLLSPGEMLLYEGRRLIHGRPTPLRGDAYANVLVHYRPCGTDDHQSALQSETTPA